MNIHDINFKIKEVIFFEQGIKDCEVSELLWHNKLKTMMDTIITDS